MNILNHLPPVRKIIFYLSLMIITYILTVIVNLPDYDLWARLAVGSLFFQTGGVLKHDIFAFTPTKDLWVDHEWGSGVVMYFFTKHFGELGLFILKAAVIFLIMLLIVRIIRLYKEEKVNLEIFYFLLLLIKLSCHNIYNDDANIIGDIIYQ